MAASDDRLNELNEFLWWSNWAEAEKVGTSGYVLLSDDFDEYFFNRGGFFEVERDAEEALEAMESRLERAGRVPHVFVQEGPGHPGLLNAFSRKGYAIIDQMSVMQVVSPSAKENPEVSAVTVKSGNEIHEWAQTYVEAFYGGLEHLDPVLRVVKGVASLERTDLILGTMDGRPAGTAALFRSEGVCGIYCVGTVPALRGSHVASTLLAHALDLAQGSRVVLQTLLSDSTESFYLGLGFRRAYVKDLFVKRASA